MIGVDTNVLVRFLVQDDPAQARAQSSHWNYHLEGSIDHLFIPLSIL